MHARAAIEAERLSIDRIRRHLSTERIGFKMYLLDEVDSTNEAARRIADAGGPEGTVVFAEAQRAGRGRLGRTWFSPPGANLYVSVLLRPALAPRDIPVFSFIASLALTDTMAALGVRAAIKWPNDVLIDGRKVAGTHVTYGITGKRVDSVILGVGVNLNVDRATLAAGLGADAARAVALAEALGEPIDRNAFAAVWLNLLETWLDRYVTRGPRAILHAWRERDALAGHRVRVRGETASWEGMTLPIDAEGRLFVQTPSGERHAVITEEIVVLD